MTDALLAAAVLALALVGHSALWVGLTNRWHSFGFSRAVIKGISPLLHTATAVIPLVVLAHFWLKSYSSYWDWRELDAASLYTAICAGLGLLMIPNWAVHRWKTWKPPRGIELTARRSVDLQRQAGIPLAHGPRAKTFCRVPGNQLWQMRVSEFTVGVPGLPAALEGLSVCHWSDLHMSGRIDPAYYAEVTRITNQLDVDVIALSGDICDKPACIDWIPATLGPARARIGKFFILGNHDLRTRQIARLRSVMHGTGFADVEGRWLSAADGKIAIGGDERPWIRTRFPTETATAGSARGSASEARERPLKILLAHTPDRLAWARRQGVDLMLSGHTHGGQLCLPVIGPTVCPSWHGVRYAGGFFYRPPTLLHVSRGTGSLLPLRINCPPEISKLTLHRV